MDFSQWLHEIRRTVEPSQVGKDHQPTANERNNLVHLCFLMIMGISFRQVDLGVIELIAGKIENLQDLQDRYVPAIADMIWDHYLGEPDNPSLEQITEACSTIVDLLFSMDEKARNDINTYPEE